MRYALFGSEYYYYAEGGANDFIKSSENKDELFELGKKMEDENFRPTPVVWWHVFDVKKGTIISGTKYQAHGAPHLPDNICV
ncbi:MAG: hypothetical protein WEA58_04070 [Balneolaceae bacterium]